MGKVKKILSIVAGIGSVLLLSVSALGAGQMTAEQAKQIAAKQVSKDSTYRSTKDDGNEYEIKFYRESNQEWYELGINKSSQSIISYESELTNHNGGTAVTLNEAEVKKIVTKEHKSADIISVSLEKDDGFMEYEVKFKANNCYGKYTIHPSSGIILKRDITIGSIENVEAIKDLITYEEASKKALEQYPGAVVTDVDLKWRNNSYIYKMELVQNGVEYEIKLDGKTGKVLQNEQYDSKKIVTKQAEYIDMEKVKQILLAKVPGAFIKECELDFDDGIACYEGELSKDGYEYEFKIDAGSGKILKWEKEWND